MQRFVTAWMKGHGQPLKEVAFKIGVAESTISQWAHGHRFPKPEELDALARCANVATGCLFCPALARTYEQDAVSL
jgi:transcriptional regulator with XRE-family HTH domain